MRERCLIHSHRASCVRGATARHARAGQCIRRAWAPVEHPEAGLAVSWPCFRSRRYERLLDMSTTHDQRHARSGAAGATASQYTSLRAWQLFGEADPSPHARGQPCILGAAHARIFATPPCRGAVSAGRRPAWSATWCRGACDVIIRGCARRFCETPVRACCAGRAPSFASRSAKAAPRSSSHECKTKPQNTPLRARAPPRNE